MTNTEGLLHARIRDRRAVVAVIGLGYVGLPSAVLFSQAGYSVVGIERNPERVACVNRGESYIGDVSTEDLRAAREQGHLRATPEFDAIGMADVVTICVPTPVDEHKSPDLTYMRSALQSAGPFWHAGQLVVLESTTYPGTTEEVLVPSLTERGLRVGTDVFAAFSPERIDPGNRSYTIAQVPRVVGGVTPQCTELAATFYRQVLRAPVFPVSSPRVAEMTKLLENVFRVVNVSLVTELARLCERMGMDVWEVIDAASTKPYGFMPFYPGPGVGGHCIPVDPYYLSWKAKEYGFRTRFIDLAGELNDQMPEYVVQQVSEILNLAGKSMKEARIFLLGVAFKRDVADTRESAALKVAEGLVHRGCRVSYYDPYVPTLSLNSGPLSSVPLTAAALQESDLVLITTDHSNVDYSLVTQHSPLVYDTRNAMKGFSGPQIFRLGAAHNRSSQPQHVEG